MSVLGDLSHAHLFYLRVLNGELRAWENHTEAKLLDASTKKRPNYNVAGGR